MQRYLPSGFGYKYFSSPFQNSVVGDFATFMNLVHPITGFPHFYFYNENREHTTGEDLSGWEAYTDALSGLTSGSGYAANISDINSPVTVELSGEVVSGNVSLSLQNNNGTYTKGFNLVGNPYPSPIDWNLVNKNGIDDAMYFFTAGSGDRYTGSYTSFVNGVSSDGRSSNIIPSMQGFFVKVSNPGSTGTLSFTDAARVGNSTSQTFYQAKRTGIQSKIVVTAGFKNEDKQDHLVLYSFPGATINFEKEYDAQKLFNTSLEIPSFYSLTPAREKLSINAVSGFEKTTITEIPLGYKARKSGKMIIDLSEFPETLDSPHIYLKDKVEKVLWNLTNGKYSFSTQKGDFNSRFSLVLSPNMLTSKDIEEAFRSFEIQISAGEILVKSKLSEGVDGEIQLSNPTGKILQLRSVSGKEEINFSGLQTGIYFVTLRTRENKETRKILVQQ
jgi:hypothetical protein